MPRTSHEIDYHIHGDETQFVEVELDPGETVVAEAGAMMYMEPGIELSTKMGDGSDDNQGLMGKLFSAAKRVVTGESLFMTHFTHTGSGKAKVAFGAPYPGKIIPLDLAQTGTILAQKDAFLCSAKGNKMGIGFTKKFGAGLFGGEGFILQKFEGDGLVLIHAGGTVIRRELAPGQTLRVDTGCIVAFQEHVHYDIKLVGGIKNTLFGGEGLFFATLTGPGAILLQSLPFSRLADRIVAATGMGGRKEEGSILGGIGQMMSGD
jgi:uncharacterized protein (TIGR00266 family)